MFWMAIPFSVLYVVIFIQNLMLSVHGSKMLPAAALFWLVVSLAATLFAGFRFRGATASSLAQNLRFLALAVPLALVGLSLSPITLQFEEAPPAERQTVAVSAPRLQVVRWR